MKATREINTTRRDDEHAPRPSLRFLPLCKYHTWHHLPCTHIRVYDNQNLRWLRKSWILGCNVGASGATAVLVVKCGRLGGLGNGVRDCKGVPTQTEILELRATSQG